MRRSLTVLIVPLLLGCGSMGPSQLLDLTGTWTASHVESSTTLSLVQQGDLVNGSGQYHRFINPPSGTIAVSGSFSHARVTLTFRYDSGVVTTFAGTLPDPAHLLGVETYPGGNTDTLLFARR